MAEDQVAEIKSKIDIVELISGYVTLKKGGKNYKALCPFHNEKTPSFMVSPELQIFKCFGCGRGGDCFAFFQEIEGIDFREALEILAERAGVKLEHYQPSPQEDKRREIIGINQAAQEYFHYILEKHRVGEGARDYLKSRGIAKEMIKTFGLGYAPDSWESLSKFLLAKKHSLTGTLAAGLAKLRPQDNAPYDFFRGRIIFPFFGHNQQTIGFAGRTLGDDEPKYLNIGETLAFKKGSFLYGLSQAKAEIKRLNEAVVVEGPFDVISPFQAGTKNIVGSQGTALTLDQIRLLKRHTKNAVLCFDTDLAGDAAARRGIELAEQKGLNVKLISLPSSFKDADELAQKEPLKWFEAVKSAISVYDFYFQSTFKRYDPNDPLGKKEIAGELLPLIKSIPNEIEREHYLQKLASALGIEVDVVKSAMEGTERTVPSSSAPRRSLRDLKFKVQNSDSRSASVKESKLGLEEYVLALVLKAPLELAQKTLHKLGQNDFEGELAHQIFVKLKDYLSGRRRKLDVEVFGGKLEKSAKELLGKVYLCNLDRLSNDETALEEELKTAAAALKKKGLQRQLKFLSQRIRGFELAGDQQALTVARGEFNKVSSQLSNI